MHIVVGKVVSHDDELTRLIAFIFEFFAHRDRKNKSVTEISRVGSTAAIWPMDCTKYSKGIEWECV